MWMTFLAQAVIIISSAHHTTLGEKVGLSQIVYGVEVAYSNLGGAVKKAVFKNSF